MNNRNRAEIVKTSYPYIGPAVVFIASLALALPMLPTVPVFQDSGEFVAAAATLGIAHPSGYPIYVILGHIASWLPFGTVPWRSALLSALSAAGAATALFVIARRAVSFRIPKPGAAVEAAIAGAVLLVATGDLWWSHAVFAKPYALHLLLLSLFLYAAMRFSEHGGRTWAAASAFFLALAFSNHLFLTLAFVPGVFVAFSVAGRRGTRPRSWGTILPVLGAFVLGCTPYLLLWFRRDAPFSFGTIGSWMDVLAHVLRTRYADTGLGGSNKLGLVLLTVGTVSLPVFAALLLGAAHGARRLWSSGRSGRFLLALMLGLFSAYPLIVVLRDAGWSEENGFGYRPFALPGFAALAVFAAVGAGAFMETPVLRKRVFRWGVLALMAAALAWNVVVNAPSVAPYSDPFPDRYVRSMLEPLPADAVLVVADYGLANDAELFLLAALQTVGGVRTDVTVVSDVGIRPFFMPELPYGHAKLSLEMRRRLLLDAALKEPAFRARPVYASFAPEGASPGLSSVTNGIVFGVIRDGVEPPRPEASAAPLPAERSIERNLALRGLVSHVLYNRASLFAERGERQEAYALLERAIQDDPLPMSPDYRGFVARRDAINASR